MTTRTRRQKEVLDHLSDRGAFSRDKAAWVFGGDHTVADKLTAVGAINKRYDEKHGDVYWIRAEGEPESGMCIPAGFVIVLSRDLTTPKGKKENFFLARAPYDGKGATFRRLLRSWMTKLGLSNKDLLSSAMGFELIPADSPVFGGDHVILEEK